MSGASGAIEAGVDCGSKLTVVMHSKRLVAFCLTGKWH
jgi:hypothetical protein